MWYHLPSRSNQTRLHPPTPTHPTPPIFQSVCGCGIIFQAYPTHYHRQKFRNARKFRSKRAKRTCDITKCCHLKNKGANFHAYCNDIGQTRHGLIKKCTTTSVVNPLGVKCSPFFPQCPCGNQKPAQIPHEIGSNCSKTIKAYYGDGA